MKSIQSTKLIVSLAVICSLFIGCATSGSRYSQAEMNAIETRIVDATFNETFSAASNALFDAGYTLSMSDREAGLLSGTAGKDNTAARIWISPFIGDLRFAISVQVRELSETQCSVRVKTSVNGEPKVDKKAIDNIWVLMQRQVMMKEPMELDQKEDV